MKKLSILMTSDTHGHWLGRLHDDDHSLFHTAGALETIRDALNHPVLTIDLGDFIQGSSFATYCYQVAQDGRCFARAMNALDYDYQLIGNHEFNFGPDYRDKILNDLDAQILCANIVAEETGQPFKGKAYDIIERDGIKIGIIGLTTQYIPNWELPKHYEGLRFLDAFETAKKYVERLRPQVDVLIVAYHGGFEADLNTGQMLEEDKGENLGAKILKEISGIDVLLTGHQHRLINQEVKTTWAIQPGHGGERLAQVTLTLDEENQVVKREGYLHEVDTYVPAESLREPLSPQLEEGKAWLGQVLGYAPLAQPYQDLATARLKGHPFVEFLNRIQLAVTGADFSGVALVNEYFADFKGAITNETLLKAYPYYNLIARVNLTGKEIHKLMEYNLYYYQLGQEGNIEVNPTYIEPKPKHYNYDLYSGFFAKVDISQPQGQRIVEILDERTGLPLDLDKTYRVALSQYRAVGGGDYVMLGQDKIEEITNIDIASAIVEALKTMPSEQWNDINHHYHHLEWMK